MTRSCFLALPAWASLLISAPRAAGEPLAPAEQARAVARLDADGAVLPAAAVARLGSLRLYHGGWIQRLVFLRDGKTLLSSGDGVLRAWDVATGKEVALPVTHKGVLQSFTIAPNGKLLASIGDDRTLRVFDLKTGLVARQWALGAGHGSALAFSAEGSLVAWVDAAAKIHVHNLAGDRELRVLAGHENAPENLAFSADGKKLASISYNEGIICWDLASGKRIRRYAPGKERVYLAASNGVFFSTDNRSLLATTNAGSVVCYDIDSVEERFKIEFSAAATSLAVSPDASTRCRLRWQPRVQRRRQNACRGLWRCHPPVERCHRQRGGSTSSDRTVCAGGVFIRRPGGDHLAAPRADTLVVPHRQSHPADQACRGRHHGGGAVCRSQAPCPGPRRYSAVHS
jgi:hypothetical protein